MYEFVDYLRILIPFLHVLAPPRHQRRETRSVPVPPPRRRCGCGSIRSREQAFETSVEVYATVAEAAQSIRDELYNEKLGEKKAAEIAEQIKGMTSLEAIADALGTTVSSQSGVTFASMGSGTLDPKFIGALSNAPIGVVSGPVPGTIGVYVYQVKGRDTGSFYTEDDAALYELQKNQYNSQMLMSVMMDDADVKDNRARFF